MKRHLDWTCIVVWGTGLVIGIGFWWFLIACLISVWTNPQPTR